MRGRQRWDGPGRVAARGALRLGGLSVVRSSDDGTEEDVSNHDNVIEDTKGRGGPVAPASTRRCPKCSIEIIKLGVTRQVVISRLDAAGENVDVAGIGQINQIVESVSVVSGASDTRVDPPVPFHAGGSVGPLKVTAYLVIYY